MPSPLLALLTHLVPVAVMLALGLVVARNGPQGYVHGLGDWHRTRPDTQRRAGRATARALYAMAALMAARALYVYRFHPDPRHMQWATLAMVAGLGVVIVGLLLRLAALRRHDGTDRHGG